MKTYYIYTHSLDNVVFYVGCGKIRDGNGFREIHSRAFELSKRSKYWKDYVNGRDVTVTIISYYDTQKEAFEKETFWISRFGRLDLSTGTLVNRCPGGATVPDGPLCRAVPVIQCDLDGNEIREWPTVRSIQAETGFLKTNIVKCCRKLQHTAYGFTWKYKKNEFFENIPVLCSKYNRTSAHRPELQPFYKKKNL